MLQKGRAARLLIGVSGGCWCGSVGIRSLSAGVQRAGYVRV